MRATNFRDWRAAAGSYGLWIVVLSGALVVGCGTGEYNSRFEKTLQSARTPPPAEEPAADAADPTAAESAPAPGT